MRAEDLSRTSWVVIGVLLGLALSFARVQIGPPSPSQTDTLAKVQRDLLKPPDEGADGKQYPWVSNLLVYPSQPIPADQRVPNGPTRMTLVTYKLRISMPAQHAWQWVPGAMLLREPLEAPDRRLAAPDLTVRAYFDGVSEMVGHKVYRYAWWGETRWVYLSWTVMTTVLVGGVWPVMLNLLIGAGLGRRSEEKKLSLWQRWKAYRQDQARRRRVASPDPAVASRQTTAGPVSLTTEEMNRLSAMEAGLRDFIASGQPVAEDEDDQMQAAPAIRPLTAGPVEAPQAEPEKKDEKAYGGTFYPTVAHARQKHADDAANPPGPHQKTPGTPD